MLFPASDGKSDTAGKRAVIAQMPVAQRRIAFLHGRAESLARIAERIAPCKRRLAKSIVEHFRADFVIGVAGENDRRLACVGNFYSLALGGDLAVAYDFHHRGKPDRIMLKLLFDRDRVLLGRHARLAPQPVFVAVRTDKRHRSGKRERQRAFL